MSRNIIITGATGFIGTLLCKRLSKRGDNITVFTRSVENAKKEFPFINSFIEWNYRKPGEWASAINGKDAIIHLAGANISGKRWNEDYKKKILNSREISTRNLAHAAALQPQKPEVFISSSAVGYYGSRGEEPLTEESAAGNDFLAEVCKIWERESFYVDREEIRRVNIRTGIVLSKEEGALSRMLTPFKFFFGGPLGNGSQWFPWVHASDIVDIYIEALDNENLSGAVNASSPNPVRMKEFAGVLGKIMNRPSWLPLPQPLLRLAAGEVAEYITSSQKVIPAKLIANGYKFKFPGVEEAIKDLLQ